MGETIQGKKGLKKPRLGRLELKNKVDVDPVCQDLLYQHKKLVPIEVNRKRIITKKAEGSREKISTQALRKTETGFAASGERNTQFIRNSNNEKVQSSAVPAPLTKNEVATRAQALHRASLISGKPEVNFKIKTIKHPLNKF
tara:strand:- start:423 stop:848 length:426 start_codon:yes stop_codon:yes gene_type:complete